MKKKTLAVPMVGFRKLIVDIGCGEGGVPIVINFEDLFVLGCVGFALLFEDEKKAQDFAPEADILYGSFTISSGLPPWDNAKGEG